MTLSTLYKRDHLFDTVNIRKNIQSKSVNAGIASISSQALTFIIGVIRAGILARILSPSDYGLFAMMMVVVSFALIFKDLGLSTATIRERIITQLQVSNLFWLNTLLGIIAMVGTIALSPITVWFFNDSRLYGISFVLSIAFLFGGLSAQHLALLKRQMRFKHIAFIDILAALVSTAIGILLAFLNFHYWSLVWMYVSLNFFTCIGSWYASKWLPSLPVRNVGTRKMLHVGMDVAGLNLLSVFTLRLDKIIVGHIAKASILGLYERGNQVPQLVSHQFRLAIFSIALPALSSLQRYKEKFCLYYYRFLYILSWPTMALSVFCFIFADEVILLYFGNQWMDAAIYMKIFACKAFVVPAVTSLDQIPISLGYSRRYFWAGATRSLGTCIAVGAASYFYGIKGAAVGVSIADILLFIPFFKICTKNSGIHLRKFMETIAPPFFMTLLSGVILYYLKTIFYKGDIIFSLFFMLCYFLVILSLFVINDYFKVGFHIDIIRNVIYKYIKRKAP